MNFLKFSHLYALMFSVGTAWAEGAHGEAAHGHASVSSLIFPAVNAVLLFGFLIYKLRTPMKNHFVALSDSVAESLNRAQVKSKEAKLKLAMFQDKLDNVSTEKDKIVENAKSEANLMERKVTEELRSKIEKIQQDANLRAEFERKAQYDALSNQVMEEIVDKTRALVKGNEGYRSKISHKVTQEIKA